MKIGLIDILSLFVSAGLLLVLEFGNLNTRQEKILVFALILVCVIVCTRSAIRDKIQIKGK